MNIFNKILIFTGLRKEKNEESTKNKGIINFIKRKVLSSKKHKYTIDIHCSQPRNITRKIYKTKYNKTLSPTKHDIDNRIIIDIPEIQGLNNVGENIEIKKQLKQKEEQEKFKEKMYIFISWFYTIFINLILWIEPLYTILYIINNTNKLSFYGPSLCFDLIYPIQYTLGILYFSKDHVESFYIEKDSHLNRHFPNLDKIIYFSIFVVFISVIFNNFNLFKNILSTRDTLFPEYFELNFISQFFIIIILNISWIMGKLTFFIHIIIFSFIFCKHCLILKKFIKKITKLKKKKINKLKIDECNDLLEYELLSINDLSIKVLEIRYDLERSIDNFKNFFSIITLLGAIAIGFLLESIKTKNFNGYPWISLIHYIIFQTIFLIIILKVDKYRENLFNYIRSGNFVKRYLGRYSEKDITNKFNNNTQMVMLNMEEENSTTIDWLVLNNVLSEGWSNFSVVGVPVNDFNLIKKGITLVALILTFQSYFK